MLVFCARGHGLYANLTRFVQFGAATHEQRHRHVAVRGIEAAVQATSLAKCGRASMAKAKKWPHPGARTSFLRLLKSVDLWTQLAPNVAHDTLQVLSNGKSAICFLRSGRRGHSAHPNLTSGIDNGNRYCEMV